MYTNLGVREVCVRDNMTKLLGIQLSILTCFALGSAHTVLADGACEKKLEATKMWVLKSDPQSVCDTKPAVAVQDCMVNLLHAGKGKLRNQDFMEVYGLCNVDPSMEVQNCFKSHLDKAYNDPGYKGAQLIGDRCLMDRKKYPVKFLHKPKPPHKKMAPGAKSPN